MILLVLLVLALFVIQTLLPGRFREPATPGQPDKLAEDLGPRDQVRPFTVVGQRAARALANIQEAMPVFLAGEHGLRRYGPIVQEPLELAQLGVEKAP